MKNRVFKALLTIAILIVLAGAALSAYIFQQFDKPSSNSNPHLVMIDRGMGSLQIAERLTSEAIVDNPYIFVLASKIIMPDKTLKAGEYEFLPQTSLHDILIKIKNGDTYKRFVTIPEGLTSYEILQRLKTVSDLTWVDIPTPVEGSLLPDTYEIQKGETVTSLIQRMQTARDSILDKAWEARASDLPITTKSEALILASLIEKETGVPSERKRIAGVFINRLRLGMPLQTDPTVIYAITKGQHQNDGKGPLGRRLLLKDLQIDSPYNTYKVVGLPPTPIANAGRDSIMAALNPEHHDYIFFVADGTGGHAFARTLSEHNQNVAKWRVIRKSAETSEKD